MRQPFHDHYKWNAEQVYDFILFMANTGLRPDEAKNLQHRDVAIVTDEGSRQKILEIEVRGKRGVGYCKSMPSAVKPYERLLGRSKPSKSESRRQRQLRRRQGGDAPPPVAQEPALPQPTDHVFPGNHIKLFNGILDRANLKLDRDGNPRTAYSLRHTYICMRLMEGADIYQIAKNCRTSVEMIEKYLRSTPETYARCLRHQCPEEAAWQTTAARRCRRRLIADPGRLNASSAHFRRPKGLPLSEPFSGSPNPRLAASFWGLAPLSCLSYSMSMVFRLRASADASLTLE